MRKTFIPFLVILLFSAAQSSAQCNRQDTTRQHHVSITTPCGLAYKNRAIAVTSYNADSFGAPASVEVWENHYEFTDRQAPDYNFTLTAPEAAGFDASKNLYVVQTERPDSNIMIYDTGLALIKVISNSPGATHWTNPRGIAFDSAQNLYIVSQDSTGPAPAHTDIPNTGKLIKITDPLGAAVKTVLLTGLENPKAVAISGGNLYISEYAGNKVSRYDLYTMTSTDFVSITRPADLFTTGCILYCTEQGTNTVKVMNALNLTAGIGATISGFSSGGSPSGVVLDDAYNLFISDNDSNRVVFYNALEDGGGGGDYYSVPCYSVYSYPSLKDSLPPIGVYHNWYSSNNSIATVDTTGYVRGINEGTAILTQITGTDTITYTVNVGPCYYELCDFSSFSSLPAYFPIDTPITTNLWISLDTTIVNVDTVGTLYSVNVGSTLVDHIINRDTMSFSIFVLPTTGSTVAPIYMLTDAGAIYGPDTLCINSVIQLLEDSLNGSWSISPYIADVDIDGSIWPIDTGTAVVSYTTVNGCYAYSQSFQITIQGMPVPLPISGRDTVCREDITTLSDSTLGGTWSCADTTVATITNAGVTSGLKFDSTTIYYSVTNYCGTMSVSKTIHVDTAAANTITGDTSVCSGSVITLSDSVSGGIWSCSDSLDSISNGIFTGNAPGTDIISYSVTCAQAATSFTVTVNPSPKAGAIMGESTVCTGDTIILSDTAAHGAWICSSPSVTLSSSGVVTGITTGSVTVTYVVSTTSCGNDSATKKITVIGIPGAGSISGDTTMCTSASITLTDTATTGAWYTSDIIASVSSGTVTSNSLAGEVEIYYITSNVCGKDTASYNVNVYNPPNAGTITDLNSEFCVSAYSYASDDGDAGTWSIDNPYIASVDEYGNIYGSNPGMANVIYTVVNGCGTATATLPITADPVPDPGYISGPSEFCVSNNPTFADYGDGLPGSWSVADPAIAYIDPIAGVVTAYTSGTTTVYYTESNSCGSYSDSMSITIDPIPDPGYIISGPSEFCISDNPTFADYGDGLPGSWSVADPTLAYIDPIAGVVTPYTSGTTTVYYTESNSCGSYSDFMGITIDPIPNPGYISGPSEFCVSNDTFFHSSGDGLGIDSWTVSDLSAADMGVSTDPLTDGIFPYTAGPETIIYTESNSCGSFTTTFDVIIDSAPSAGSVYGTLSPVCPGSSDSLYTTGTGGTWSSSNTTAATTEMSGSGYDYVIVTGLTNGVDTLSYTVTNTCGTAVASQTITTTAPPYAGAISGADSVCPGSAITLTDTPAAGIWLSSNASASVSAGVVTGITAGTDTIFYKVSNTCGSDSVRKTITISPMPAAGSITGAASVCTGTSIVLTDTTPGGSWGLSNTLASITGGTVTGIAAGSVTATYIVANSCGADTATHSMIINALPMAGTILGADSVCQGAAVTFADTAAGGIWLVANASAAISGGIVTGISAGIDTIIYRVSNTCGSDSARRSVTVDPLPAAGTILGMSGVCTGDSIVLTATLPGGTWGISDAHAALSGSTVTGISAGSVTATYIVSNSCGADTAAHSITINTLPAAGTISGADSLCQSATITLTDIAAGGTWRSANTSATISGGIVSGVVAGTDTIIYKVTNACGADSTSKAIIIKPLPEAGTIIGPADLCVGDSVYLTDISTDGTWAASSGAVTVSGGWVTGLSAGIDTISYHSVNACGTSSATHIMTISPQPNAGTISGPDSLCQGNAIVLSASASMGSWVSVNGLATVTGGIVSGVSSGTDTILYNVTNACGTDSARHAIYILPFLSPGAITGTDSICVGASYTLTDTATGGVWASSNPTIVAIGPSGTATCLAAGTDTITYSVTNYCGIFSAAHTVFALSDSLCTALAAATTNSLLASNLKIYPNPSNGSFTVALMSDIDETATVTVTNTLGEKMYELKTTTNQSADIKLSSAAGVYFVNVTTPHGSYTAKLAVEN